MSKIQPIETILADTLKNVGYGSLSEIVKPDLEADMTSITCLTAMKYSDQQNGALISEVTALKNTVDFLTNQLHGV